MNLATLRNMRTIRWTSYILLIFCYMLAFFHRMAPTVLSSELQRDFMATGAELGTLAASYFYAYTLMQIPAGVLADTLGARRVVMIGGLLAGCGALLFGMAPSLDLAVAGRFLVGLGVSVIFLAVLKFCAQWFYDHQWATMTGLTILLGNVGAMLGAAPLAWALGILSWRTIFYLLGGLSLVLAILVWIFVRNRPQDVGLPSMRELEGKSSHAAIQGHWLTGLLEVVRNRDTWLAFMTSFGQGGMFFTFAGLWAGPFMRDIYGLSRSSAANHATMLLIGFAAGSMLIGILSDRLGRRRPALLIYFVGCLAAWLPIQMAWPLPLWGSLPLFFCIGFLATGYTITLASAKELNHPALSGMATGVVNTGTFLGAAVLQPLVGWMMDRGWTGQLAAGARVYASDNYQAGFAIISAALVLGFLCALRVPETYCRYLKVTKD